MITSISLILLGLIILLAGAEALVRGSTALALRRGISPVIVGLTIVSFGTSTPELVIGLDAALSGHGGITMGNVIGSNICNIALILGCSALVKPLSVDRKLIRWDVPLMIGVTVISAALIVDGRLGRIEGALLTTGIVAYNWLKIRQSRGESGHERRRELEVALHAGPKNTWLDLLLIVLGLGRLVGGGHVLISGALKAAKSLGVSEAVIALTLVAFGTSLPELATSIVACLKGEGDLAVGNAIGSNVFNLLGVLGITSLVMPYAAPDIRMTDLVVMMATAAIIFPFMRSGFVLTRREGAALLLIYAAYVGWLFLGKEMS